MASAFNVSEAASLALHATVLLACSPGKVLSTAKMASILKASEAHLSKVVQRLRQAGLLRSVRGPKGGFGLARPAHSVSLLQVYEAIEGRLRKRKCVFGKPICGNNGCIMGGLTASVDKQVRGYLSETSLAKVKKVFGGKHVNGA